MTAMPATLFRRYPSYAGPVPVWHSPRKPLFSLHTRRLLDDFPRCSRCRTKEDRKACRALALRRDGLDWARIAREVGYASDARARDQAIAHLLAEVES